MLLNIILICCCKEDEPENLYKLINKFRRANGKYPLHKESKLDLVAKERVCEEERNGINKIIVRNRKVDIGDRIIRKGYLNPIKVAENTVSIDSRDHDSSLNMMTNLTEHCQWKEPLLENYTDVGIAMLRNWSLGKKWWDIILARKENSIEPPSNLTIEGTI